MNVTHSYDRPGEYTVTLQIEDNAGLISEYATYIVKVESLNDNLPILISNTQEQLNASIKYYNGLSRDEKDFYLYSGYDKVLNNASIKLSQYKKDIDKTNISEKELKNILDGTNELRSKIIKKLFLDVNVIRGEYVDLIDYKDLTKSRSYKEGDLQTYFSFNQKHVTIDTSLYKASIQFLDGNDNVFLVHKKVSVDQRDNYKLIENLYGAATNENDFKILTSGSVLDGLLVKWDISGSKEIDYLMYTDKGGYGKSIVINTINESVETFSCGDGFCDLPYEDKDNCPVDCKKKIPWKYYIPLSIILVLGIVYFNFYRGPGNFRDIGNKTSVKLFNKRLFTNEQDLKNLSGYVKMMLLKGFKEQQIKTVLRKKGWSEEQINYAFEHKNEETLKSKKK